MGIMISNKNKIYQPANLWILADRSSNIVDKVFRALQDSGIFLMT